MGLGLGLKLGLGLGLGLGSEACVRPSCAASASHLVRVRGN